MNDSVTRPHAWRSVVETRSRQYGRPETCRR
jgi:hypothetical protein